MRGGGADSGMFVKVGGYLSSLIGGGCGCSRVKSLYGGYRQTKKNRNFLKRYKQGKSIGFTALASLKAKGLIKRSNGTYKISPKYSRK
jgi:ribosomal protein S19E (S16A)